MIKYQLLCDAEHDFEGWFRDSADFDAQSADGLIECPICGSENVRKAVMAPAIGRKSNSSREARLAEIRGDVMQAMHRARDYVEKNFDYVGDKFPEEARKIHYGESKQRGIYGEATGKDVKELVDEGVQVAPLPVSKKTDSAAGPAKAKKQPRISSDNKKLN